MSDSLNLVRSEFKKKSEILGRFGTWLNPYEFYDLLFEDLPENRKIMTVQSGSKYKAMKLEDAIEFSLGRNDVYICSSTFYENYKKDSFIDYIYAFVIDIDNVTPMFAEALLISIGDGKITEPTVIVNSGSGIHFYYILDEPLYMYPSLRKLASALYKEMNRSFEFETDKHSIGHAYRAVGGTTKAGDIAAAYKIGEKWKVEDLAEEFAVIWQLPDPAANADKAATDAMVSYAKSIAERNNIPEPDYANFNETYSFIRKNKPKTFPVVSNDLEQADTPVSPDRIPHGRAQSYRYMVEGIIEKTELEHRYYSLFALSIMAYKCHVSRSQLEQDISHIVSSWRQRSEWRDNPFTEKHIPAAMRGYSDKYLYVHRDILEEYLGWSFPRKRRSKRGEKSRSEHMQDVGQMRALTMYGRVLDYFRQNPAAENISQIAEEIGCSRTTVYKYIDRAKTEINTYK